MKILKILIVSIILSLIIACEEDVSDSGIGPCVHTYKEPILHIESIQDSLGNELNFVKLYNLRINGSLQNRETLIINSYSVVKADSVFYCNIPFGFGVEEGKYEFTIEAEGYEIKEIRIEDVKYEIFKGSCPSYNDGGKRIELNIN